MSRSFSTANDQIDMGAWNLLAGATSASWAFWINPSAASQSARLLTKWAGSPNAQFLIALTSGKVQFALSTGSAAVVNINATAAITTNAWTQVVVTFTAPTTWAIYYNGVSQSISVTTGTGLAALHSSTIHLQVGRESGESISGVKGLYGELAIWSGLALAQADVNNLAAGVCPGYVQAPYLAGYWPLKGYSNPEPDLSAFENPGQVFGTVAAAHPSVTTLPHLSSTRLYVPPVAAVSAPGLPSAFAFAAELAAASGGATVATVLPAAIAFGAELAAATGGSAVVAAALPAAIAFGADFATATGTASAAPLPAAVGFGTDFATAQASASAAPLPASWGLSGELSPATAGIVAYALPGAAVLSGAPLGGTGTASASGYPAGVAFAGGQVSAQASGNASDLPGCAAFVASLCAASGVAPVLPGNLLSGAIAFVATPILQYCPGTPVCVSSSAADAVCVSSSAADSVSVGCCMITSTLYCPRAQAKTWTFSYCPSQAIGGYNFLLNIRQYFGGPILLQQGGTVTDATNGAFTVSLTSEQTVTLSPGPYVWDVWRIDAGSEDQLGAGAFEVTESYWQ